MVRKLKCILNLFVVFLTVAVSTLNILLEPRTLIAGSFMKKFIHIMSSIFVKTINKLFELKWLSKSSRFYSVTHEWFLVQHNDIV